MVIGATPQQTSLLFTHELLEIFEGLDRMENLCL
jgi:hypothetical protein